MLGKGIATGQNKEFYNLIGKKFLNKKSFPYGKKINFKGLGLSLMVACTIVVYTLVDAKGARLSDSAISYGIYMFALEGIIFNITYIIF